MRKRAEDETRLVEGCLGDRIEPERASANADALAGAAVGRGERERHARMAINEGTQLAPRIPAGSENSHWYSMHT